MNNTKDPGFGRGLLFGFGSYLIWGSFPLIITMLTFASAWEVVSWRIVFGFLVAALLTTVTRSWPAIIGVLKDKNLMKWMALATVFIATNWTVYVIGVSSQQTIQTALGYFINPLVTILLAVIFLGEKLSIAQWIATGFGTLAVIVLTFDYGQLPWIALTLAGSFGIYGLAKNKIGGRVTAINSFAMEAGMLLPLAAVQLAIIGATLGGGGIQFGNIGFWGTAGLIFFGVLTAVPLIMFGTAAQLLPLRYLGFIQYTTPVLQFCLAIFVLGEPMPAARWIGFGLVWIGLAVLISDAVRSSRRTSKNATSAVDQAAVINS
jgi:chloramphenicol-sensitive protein RarD